MIDDWLIWLEDVDPDYYLEDLEYQLAGDDFMSLAPFPREDDA